LAVSTSGQLDWAEVTDADVERAMKLLRTTAKAFFI
jgi:hypothetical protein